MKKPPKGTLREKSVQRKTATRQRVAKITITEKQFFALVDGGEALDRARALLGASFDVMNLMGLTREKAPPLRDLLGMVEEALNDTFAAGERAELPIDEITRHFSTGGGR